ncbi:MAG: biopolymer transporter ExbD [Deltaproteobacteria bacterium]|nr:biopolymer transporter ExbD [Deltaproteobacteria bacterium]
MAGELSDVSSSGGEPISSINVTPFVDVTLVLLVIFIVTAPALMKDTLSIRLPKAASSEHKNLSSFGIAITKQGQILVDGQLSTDEALAEKARTAVAANPEVQAILSADVDARHGDVVKVIDLMKTAGLTHFAIQIQH